MMWILACFVLKIFALNWRYKCANLDQYGGVFCGIKCQ
jgi:hypothetical protein